MSTKAAAVAAATPPGVSPTADASLADTMDTLGASIKAKLAGLAEAIDPRNVDLSALRTHLPKLPQMSAMAMLTIAIVVIAALLISVYYIVRLYRTNVRDYPVLLSDPIRGANIGTTASRQSLPTYPVIDRDYTRYDGITLPYRANDIALMDEPQRMPPPNHSVEFTLNFWLRIENFQYNNPTGTKGALESYTELFRQNPTTRQFRVLYDATDNTLVIAVHIRSKQGLPHTPGTPTPQTRRVEVFRVPRVLLIQEWQMVTLVLENRDLDVYHNGKLYRSFHLANVPDLVGNEWRLFPGQVPFTGMVSCARYFHYGFNAHEVARLYRWLDGKPVPREAYFFWWTWYRGNSFTALFDNFQKRG